MSWIFLPALPTNRLGSLKLILITCNLTPAGKPTAMRIAEWTDSWAFVADALGMTLPEGF